MASRKATTNGCEHSKNEKSIVPVDDVNVALKHHQLVRPGTAQASPNAEFQTLLQMIRCPEEYPSRLLSTMLKASGAPVDTVDDEGNSLLLHAIRCRNLDAVRELLDLGADPNFIVKKKYRHTSTGAKVCQIIKWPKQARSTLHDAIDEADLDILKLLLERGANPNQTNHFGMSVLYHATLAEVNRLAILRLLLSHGADVYNGGSINPTSTPAQIARLRNGSVTVLPFAVSLLENRVDEVRLFLQHGLDIGSFTLTGINDSSPLHVALNYDNTVMLSALLEYVVKGSRCLDARDSNKETPLGLALMRGRAKQVSLLLEAGADFELEVSELNTPLVWAIFQSMHFNPECVRLLVDAGAKVSDVFQHLKPHRIVDHTVVSWRPRRFPNLDSDHESASDHESDSDHDSDSDENSDLNDENNDRRWSFMGSMMKKLSLDLEKAECVVRYRILYESRVTVEEPLEIDKIESVKLRDYYTLCKNEIAPLQNTSLYLSVTYYNLLTDKNIYKHVRDGSAYENFEIENVLRLFPVYAQDICSCFARLKESHEMWELAIGKLSRLLGLDQDAYYFIFYQILSYLRETDLHNLGKV